MTLFVIRMEAEREGSIKEEIKEGNLLSNLTANNADSDETEKSKRMRKYLSVPSLKKIAKFSKCMRRSTSNMIHNSKPTSQFDKSKIAEDYSSHPTSPPDLLLKIPIIPFWRTSFDLLEENYVEDTTLTGGTVYCVKKVDTKIDNNYMSRRKRNFEEEIVIYV